MHCDSPNLPKKLPRGQVLEAQTRRYLSPSCFADPCLREQVQPAKGQGRLGPPSPEVSLHQLHHRPLGLRHPQAAGPAVHALGAVLPGHPRRPGQTDSVPRQDETSSTAGLLWAVDPSAIPGEHLPGEAQPWQMLMKLCLMAHEETSSAAGWARYGWPGPVSPRVWETPAKLMWSLTGLKTQWDGFGGADEYLDIALRRG